MKKIEIKLPEIETYLLVRFWSILTVLFSLFVITNLIIWGVLKDCTYESYCNPFNWVNMRIVLSLFLGIPIYLGFSLQSQFFKLDKRQHSLLLALYTLQWVLSILFVVNKGLFDGSAIAGKKYFFTLAMLIFANLSLPFILKRFSVETVWRYMNWTLNAFAISFVYAAVLFVGSSAILVTLQGLLDVKVSSEVFPSLFTFLSLIYAPALFASKLPYFNKETHEFYYDPKLKTADLPTPYNKELRVFSGSILAPLVVVYFAILMVYLGKIVVTSNWPSNIVAGIIVSFAIATLLVWYSGNSYFYESTANSLQKLFGSLIFSSYFPLGILLISTVHLRTLEYGLTDNRYFLYTFATGMILIACSSLFFKQKTFLIIPLIISFLIFISNFAPFINAYDLSNTNQVKRFEYFMDKSGWLDNGKIIQAEKFDSTYIEEIIGSLKYLEKRDSLNLISPYFEDSNFAHEIEALNETNKTSEVLKKIGYVGVYNNNSRNDDYYNSQIYYRFDYSYGLEVSGFSKVLFIPHCQVYCTIVSNNQTSSLRINKSNLAVSVEGKYSNTVVSFDALSDSYKEAQSKNMLTPVIVKINDTDYLHLTSLQGEFKKDSDRIQEINSVEGYILVK